MSNKGMIIRECEHLNSARRVLEGRIDCDMFFRSICGDLLITGMEAGNKEMVLSLVRACMEKRDVSTIVLTSHQELAALIQQDQNRRSRQSVLACRKKLSSFLRNVCPADASVCLHDSRRNGIQQYGRAGNDLCGSGT